VLETRADWIHADRRVLVSRTPEAVEPATTLSCSLPELLEWFG